MRVALMSMFCWTVRCGSGPALAGPLAARPDPPSKSGPMPNVDCWRRSLENAERSHNHRWIPRGNAMLVALPCLLLPTSAFASRYELPAEVFLFIAGMYLIPVLLIITLVVVLRSKHNKYVDDKTTGELLNLKKSLDENVISEAEYTTRRNVLLSEGSDQDEAVSDGQQHDGKHKELVITWLIVVFAISVAAACYLIPVFPDDERATRVVILGVFFCACLALAVHKKRFALGIMLGLIAGPLGMLLMAFARSKARR